jgi:hypothetical protein
MLGWLVNERAIEPHIPVIDKSARDNGTFSRGDFNYNQEADIYVCPAGGHSVLRGRLGRNYQRCLFSWTIPKVPPG